MNLVTGNCFEMSHMSNISSFILNSKTPSILPLSTTMVGNATWHDMPNTTHKVATLFQAFLAPG